MSETTFKHSTARVPRLYKEAGKIVQKIKEEGGSFKGLVFQSKHRSLKSLYALVAETLRHSSELDALLRQTQLLIKEPRLDPWLARVLITELVWRQRPLSGPAVPLKIVQSYKDQLLSQHADIPVQGVQSVSRGSRPRFVRINTLKTSKNDILNFFEDEGWTNLRIPKEHLQDEDSKYASFLESISMLPDKSFIQDIHVPNLLVFPGNMQFYNLDYYHDGSLLLQDKASCMSALLLAAPTGSTVLDMCAAPGMKTTHVAATIENLGVVYAIEKHQGRHDSLCKVVSQAGATCVKPILGDTRHFTDNELPDVEYIVVDPTCSGSGMTNQRELFNDQDDVSKSRLEKLASFQCALLRHAMTNFPKAKRIVYSTCSIYPEENEAVVERVLSTTPQNFKPVIPSNGTQWMTRGSSSYDFGPFGLYARPEIDLTNGFFLVMFERTENDYVLGKMMDMIKEVSDKESSNKKRKRKDKSIANSSESGSIANPLPNPALERMKKAMENFSNLQTKTEKQQDNSHHYTSNEDCSINKVKRSSKKRKIKEEDDLISSNDVEDSYEIEKKRKSKKGRKEKDITENGVDAHLCESPGFDKCVPDESVEKSKKKEKKKKMHDLD